MPSKVSIQIIPEARDALIPLRQAEPIVAWNLINGQDGSTILTLQRPETIMLARELRIPFILTAVASLWAGFYVGRFVHTRRKKR